MHYGELKSIIRHLKKVVPCSNCQKKFEDEAIRVLTTFNQEALFHFTCFNCKNQIIVHVSVTEQNEAESKLSIQTQNAPKISYNDFLDIHNFLNQFDGDFKDLFQHES